MDGYIPVCQVTGPDGPPGQRMRGRLDDCPPEYAPRVQYAKDYKHKYKEVHDRLDDYTPGPGPDEGYRDAPPPPPGDGARDGPPRAAHRAVQGLLPRRPTCPHVTDGDVIDPSVNDSEGFPKSRQRKQ